MEQLEVLVLREEHEIYMLPDGVQDIDDILEFINDNMDRYVKLMRIGCHDCVYPFVIDEFIEYTPVCINFANYKSFETDTLFVLSKEEYDERLTQLIEENCQDCIHYEEGDDIDSHRNHMCLNGFCPEYRSKNDENPEDDDI